MNRWEHSNPHDMLVGLIGYDFGPTPENCLDEIRNSKKSMADFISKKLNLTERDNVLELGSGCGFLSYWIAQNVKHLHCCDISSSYLDFAKKECRDIGNAEFHHIKPLDLSSIESNSITALYSLAVFIHLNLFDIYWYFSEFDRVLTKGGRIWFDIANAERLDPNTDKYFMEMARYYKADQSTISGLMQWNSSKAIDKMAKAFNFKIKAFANQSQFILIKR
ncbi:MAG: hypothetical protein Tsb0027_22330 [Wenzhouxiangellaceae bacterium]